MTAPAHPAQAATAELAREFAAWQIDLIPGSRPTVAAYWRSPDGRSRRYIVRRSTAELLAQLRAIGPVQ
jgi:hypothetical protein